MILINKETKMLNKVRAALMLSPAQWSTVKEAARIVVFAVAAWVLTAAGEWVGAADQTQAWVGVVTVAIRLADKWIHKTETTELNGLLPW
jgi:hypothetical protein